MLLDCKSDVVDNDGKNTKSICVCSGSEINVWIMFSLEHVLDVSRIKTKWSKLQLKFCEEINCNALACPCVCCLV